ncbi:MULTISPECIES: hypothetical protein [unclassified Colwellia]|uniref:hypothetical protein n=1 Tax=unclassified Colwellia TaxID=196834 RepID=UPI0015F4DDA2|nr:MULTISPECIES: hypothetical protein [unclassified Colwellia]MBA6346592.1 hypothetical protein [Colwellia sp. BRX8-9]MBA6385230.1 hypothetical protein [Colwellia sp. BRX10-9]MBA6396090.1 hypothetical protein [Colwellia sp. BRX10-6]
MSQDEIKSIVKKYKFKSVKILMGFLLIAVFANWYLINLSIERHAELGLPYTSSDSGFIWGAISTGLYTVLALCFYSIEKILLKLLIKPKTESE